MKIDIWVGIAANGGVESVINRTSAFLKKKGVDVRVIQLVWTGKSWLESGAEFHFIIDGPLTDWDGVFERYVDFYEKHDIPDVVITEGWPILNIFAKKLVMEIGMSFKIASRLHDAIDFYERTGVGGLDYLQYADVHLALNSGVERLIRDGIRGAIIHRVSNPIDTGNLYYNEDRDIRELAYVGRISEEKGVPLLIRAVSNLTSIKRLTLVGDGPDAGKIREMTAEMGVSDKVVFASWQKNPWEYVKNAGTLLVASEREIGPLVAIEAMACGMSVITKPVGIMPDVIMEGVNGYIYNDENELSEILDDMASGMKMIPDPRDCKESVEELLGEGCLEELLRILETM